MDAGIRINRIKAKVKPEMSVLAAVLAPEILHSAVPRLGEVQEARVLKRNMMNELQQWGKHTRTSGWVPDRSMQYVAQIDQSVWSAILEVFGKYDPDTGVLIDDGLLYVVTEKGELKLNKPFFYALLEMLESAGYTCDMRGKVKLT